MATLKVRYEDAIYEISTCFDEAKCAAIAAKYPPDGIVDISAMLASPRTSDEELVTDPEDKRSASSLRDWLVTTAKRKAAEAKAEAEEAAKPEEPKSKLRFSRA